MIDTTFTRLVGCSAPIQLAGMPGIATVELAAAVADAGGVGMIGASLLSAAQLEAELDTLAGSTRGVVGVNFLMPFLDRACVDVAARGARIVEFFYGTPEVSLVDAVHQAGALVSWQVGSRGEADEAVGCGCDFIVVQGTEAGGHVRGSSSLLPLLSEVAAGVDVPVVAAGGLATAQDVAAVLAQGAAGARLGTCFVAARESGAHPDYVAALLAASAADTCLTEAFSGLWPNAPHRVLRSAIAAAEALDDDCVGVLRHGDIEMPVTRFSVMSPTRATTGRVDAMALYAGESVENVSEIRPAAAIVAELVAGAERLLGEASGQKGGAR